MIAHGDLRVYTREDYYATPEGTRVELVRGLFRDMASPSRRHQDISRWLFLRIGRHIEDKKLSCRLYAAPFDVDLSETEEEDTVVQPDISVICDLSKLTRQGCTGGPDFIIEIVSPRYFNYDNDDKKQMYRRAGVREYWIVDAERRKIIVYLLDRDGGEDDIFLYSFTDKVPVHICEDLTIDFSTFDWGEE